MDGTLGEPKAELAFPEALLLEADDPPGKKGAVSVWNPWLEGFPLTVLPLDEKLDPDTVVELVLDGAPVPPFVLPPKPGGNPPEPALDGGLTLEEPVLSLQLRTWCVWWLCPWPFDAPPPPPPKPWDIGVGSRGKGCKPLRDEIRKGSPAHGSTLEKAGPSLGKAWWEGWWFACAGSNRKSLGEWNPPSILLGKACCGWWWWFDDGGHKLNGGNWSSESAA